MLVDHRLLVCLLAIGCLHRVIMCLLVIERVCLLCACVCVCGWVGGGKVVARAARCVATLQTGPVLSALVYALLKHSISMFGESHIAPI